MYAIGIMHCATGECVWLMAAHYIELRPWSRGLSPRPWGHSRWTLCCMSTIIAYATCATTHAHAYDELAMYGVRQRAS